MDAEEEWLDYPDQLEGKEQRMPDELAAFDSSTQMLENYDLERLDEKRSKAEEALLDEVEYYRSPDAIECYDSELRENPHYLEDLIERKYRAFDKYYDSKKRDIHAFWSAIGPAAGQLR